MFVCGRCATLRLPRLDASYHDELHQLVTMEISPRELLRPIGFSFVTSHVLCLSQRRATIPNQAAGRRAPSCPGLAVGRPEFRSIPLPPMTASRVPHVSTWESLQTAGRMILALTDWLATGIVGAPAVHPTAKGPLASLALWRGWGDP